MLKLNIYFQPLFFDLKQKTVASLLFLLVACIVIRTEGSLETRAEPAIYRVYVENCLILESSTFLGAKNVNIYLKSGKV